MSRLTKENNPLRTKVAPDLMLSKTNYLLHNASMAYNPKELYHKSFEFKKMKLIKHYSDAIIVYLKRKLFTVQLSIAQMNIPRARRNELNHY
jgi:hypothetical protein